jgi:hypothetical protein
MLSGAPCVREVDQPPGNPHRLGGHAKCRMQSTAVDDGGQPVGAEQVTIADERGAERQVRLDLSGARAQGPHQQRPLRMGGGLVGGELALIHQRLHVVSSGSTLLWSSQSGGYRSVFNATYTTSR